MKTKITLMAPETEGVGVGSGTNSTNTPSDSGPSTTTTPVEKLRDPKHNPWADETARLTAQGEQTVKPAVVAPKPTAQPTAPATPPTAPAIPPTTSAAQPPQTGQSLDPKALAKEFAAELRNVSQQPAEPTKPLSDEEFDAHFGMPKVDANTYAAILGFAPEKPEQVAALAQTLRGMSTATLRMANHLMQQRLESLEQKLSTQFAPALQATQAQLEQRVQDEFFRTYPGLKDQIPLLVEIREMAEAQAKLGKLSFKTPQEVINYVAEKAAKFLGRPVESFKTATTSGGGQVTTQNQSAGASRQMTTASTGGRTGGASSAASNAKPRSTAESLFGRNDD
jgi:hypothetical protein